MTGGSTTSADQASAEAVARVEAVLEQLGRVDLQLLVVGQPDATRLAARDRARAAAANAGRTQLFEDAMAAARDTAMRAFARDGFSGTWAITERSVSVANAQDRVAAAAAFEEAAMAAVVEDLLDQETLEILGATAGGLQRFRGLPQPGSLSLIGERAGWRQPTGPGPTQVAAFTAALLVVVALLVVFGSGAGILAIALAAAIGGWFGRRRSGEGS